MTNTQSVKTNVFYKGINKDTDPKLMGEGEYLNAINAANNSDKGDLVNIGNEPSNLKKASIPYTYIGNIPLKDQRYAIFSTNNTDSEIGIYDNRKDVYTVLLNDSSNTCKLGLKTSNLVRGVSRENFDCSESIYWNDGLNPARTLNINNIPYVIKFRPDPSGGCDIEETTSQIDCEKLRLFPLLTIPQIEIVKGNFSGNLENGSYRVAFAYSSDLFRISDYLLITKNIYLHSDTVRNGSLEITMSELDKDFKYYELVLISTVNQQTTARSLGFYPVEQTKVTIDSIKDENIVNLASIVNQSVYYEGGDAMFKVNDYLIQTGVRTRPDFNYQPQASKIRSKWVAYAVPENYYRNSGSKIGYTKGEVASFYIRFVYNTGHKTNAYCIVGREASNDEKSIVVNADARSYNSAERVEKWKIYDTSTITKLHPISTAPEYPVMEGEFGYFESAETYPDNKEVWGNDACRNIRLSRFPDNCIVPNWDNNKKRILILGVKFENISYPLDENGNPVDGIVGYEILKADKEGNKTIEAKGLIFNTGEYDLPTSLNETTKALYPNYPLNDLRTDPYLSKRWVNGGCNGSNYQEMGTFNRQFFTFHSPETSFGNPYLGSHVKVEAEYRGKAKGNFEEVYRHPKHKLIRDFAVIVAGAVGIGEGILAIRGKTTKVYEGPSSNFQGLVGVTTDALGAAAAPATSAWQTAYNIIRAGIKNLPVASLLGNTVEDAFQMTGLLLGTVPGVRNAKFTYTREETAYSNIPTFVQIGTNVVLFSYFFGQGAQKTLEVIQQLVPYRQHAYQCNLEALYNSQTCPVRENIIRKVEDYTYLNSGYQDFQGFRVNNNLRESSVLLKLNEPLSDPTLQDKSRQTIGTLNNWSDPSKVFETDTSAYYISVKNNRQSPYGQIGGAKIIPTDNIIYNINQSSTPIIFGGDTIIDEFTFKRKMSFFTQQQYEVPNGFEYNYKLYPNIVYPRYWMNTEKYDLTELFNLTSIKLPNDFFYLDRKPSDCRRKLSFSVKEGYCYLHNSAVVRFFVESSYNLPFRKNDNDLNKKHYNKYNYTDTSTLLRTDILRNDNYYEVDKSLSPIKQLNFTYSQILPRDFSVKNNKCFTYEPNKLIYSLPSSSESKKDNWRIFLANNYYSFPRADGKLVNIKGINKTGAMYFFESSGVKMHPGVDELQTEGGIKIQLGDGGLFARQLQSLTNTDYDLTECQSSNSVVNTQYGIFFISQKQGKIFRYTGSMQDISSPIKWWLSEYLPSRLVSQYPDFELIDNTVIGVGCQTVYDVINEIVYFSKIDYSVKPEFRSRISYISGNEFLFDKKRKVTLGDPRFFDDASWTLSYDPKINEGRGGYISFHDWHPQGMIQTKSHILTVKDNGIWEHNTRTDSFCNFYGVDYPWEINYVTGNIQEVNALSSIEYLLNCYKYYNDSQDRFNILEENFDRAIVYNNEQCSGLLKLNMREINRPSTILNYPSYTATGVEIEAVKVEQKYRINQFIDLIKNRGQFTLNYIPIFITEENGYKSAINPSAIDYNKSPEERKRFRSNIASVILRKNISGEVKMLLSLINSKQVKSFR